MEAIFDITDDEVPIFLAEADEQLQLLDEGLVRLERSEQDADLLQALFRAAHTLKGSSGMIGHRRMVELTHNLEAAFDGLRKETLEISIPLIDACLEAVDLLRVLRDEVSGGSNTTEIGEAVARLGEFTAQGGNGRAAQPNATAAQPVFAPVPVQSAAAPKARKATHRPGKSAAHKAPATLAVEAEISPASIASAARALQIVLALQDCGTILRMQPDQDEIDSASPVSVFRAEVIPSVAVDEIFTRLLGVGDIDRLKVGEYDSRSQPAALPVPVASHMQVQAVVKKNGKPVQADAQPGRVIPVIVEPTAPMEAPAAAVDAGAVPGSKARGGEKTVRTSVERLDNLMNLVGEMITDRNRLNMIRTGLLRRFRGDEDIDSMADAIGHIGLVTDQLQAEVMGIRMLPISNVFNKFPRMVRDLAHKSGKQIDLVMSGEDTELDRSVIEEISDPLIHLLRNAADHGIETPDERTAAGKSPRGEIRLNASPEQGHILITVEDNGRGIDAERLRNKAVEKGLMTRADADVLDNDAAIDLIFLPGLSTAKVVSDISGRGVGMDIVRNNIEKLNGTIQVETRPGQGTTFLVILPLTLAIVPTLLVRVGLGTYAIPLVTIREILRVPHNEIHSVNRRPVINLRDSVLPLARLGDVLRLKNTLRGRTTGKHEYVVVVSSGKNLFGLIVDGLVGEEEVVVKSLSTVMGDVSGVSSAAILGDGQVALILDTQGIFKLAAMMQITSTPGGPHNG